jgi:hypothetical protein
VVSTTLGGQLQRVAPIEAILMIKFSIFLKILLRTGSVMENLRMDLIPQKIRRFVRPTAMVVVISTQTRRSSASNFPTFAMELTTQLTAGMKFQKIVSQHVP